MDPSTALTIMHLYLVGAAIASVLYLVRFGSALPLATVGVLTVVAIALTVTHDERVAAHQAGLAKAQASIQEPAGS